MSGGWAAAAQAVGQIGGQLISNASNANRQRKAFNQQKELMDIQHRRQRELNSQGADLQYDLWNKTNAEAQVKHLEKAGLNVGMMYGGSGAGGATTGSQGGGSAASGNAPQMPAYQMDIGAAMMQARQAELMAAQADKARAEAENLRGGVRGNLEQDQRAKAFQNDINEKYRHLIEQGQAAEWDMKSIEGDEKNYAWIWRKTLEYGQDNDGSQTKEILKTRKGRQINAEVLQMEEDLKNAKAAGDVSRAEAVIREFEAALTEDGISPNSPWYAKLVTELLKKIGVVDFIKNETKGK